MRLAQRRTIACSARDCDDERVTGSSSHLRQCCEVLLSRQQPADTHLPVEVAQRVGRSTTSASTNAIHGCDAETTPIIGAAATPAPRSSITLLTKAWKRARPTVCRATVHEDDLGRTVARIARRHDSIHVSGSEPHDGRDPKCSNRADSPASYGHEGITGRLDKGESVRARRTEAEAKQTLRA